MFDKRQAKEIADGAKNLLLSKFGLTTEEQEKLFAARMDVCNACPHKFMDSDQKVERCSLCGCFLSMKTKSITSECPDGLW